MSSLPVADFSSSDRDANARTIVHAMETVGFVQLENVPGFDEVKLQEATKWMFSMPLQQKLRVARKKFNKDARTLYRGYFPVDDTAVSYKEGYDFGPEIAADDPELESAFPFCEHNVWPENEDGEDDKPFRQFRETMMAYHKAAFSAGTEFTRLLAMGLGLGEEFFDHLFFPKSLSTLRILHYPPRPTSPPPSAMCDDGTILCCDPHVDSGMLTLLSTFNNPGLQILTKDGPWMNVQSCPGTLIANLGKLMSEMSGGRIKATEHQVVETELRDRYSCAFFLEPGYFTHVPLSLPTGGRQCGEVSEAAPASFQYGPYVAECLKQWAEYGDLE